QSGIASTERPRTAPAAKAVKASSTRAFRSFECLGLSWIAFCPDRREIKLGDSPTFSRRATKLLNNSQGASRCPPHLTGRNFLLHLTGLLALGHHIYAQDAKRLVRLIYLRFHSHVVTVMPVQAVRIFDVPRLLIFVIHKNSFAVLALYPTRQPNGLAL